MALVLNLAGLDAAESKRRAVELLDYLEFGHRKDVMPAKLSCGKTQCVAIARALANQPRIILADNSAGFTAGGSSHGFVRKVADKLESAVLAVTHDEKTFNCFDRIFYLRDGRLEVENS